MILKLNLWHFPTRALNHSSTKRTTLDKNRSKSQPRTFAAGSIIMGVAGHLFLCVEQPIPDTEAESDSTAAAESLVHFQTPVTDWLIVSGNLSHSRDHHGCSDALPDVFFCQNHLKHLESDRVRKKKIHSHNLSKNFAISLSHTHTYIDIPVGTSDPRALISTFMRPERHMPLISTYCCLIYLSQGLTLHLLLCKKKLQKKNPEPLSPLRPDAATPLHDGFLSPLWKHFDRDLARVSPPLLIPPPLKASLHGSGSRPPPIHPTLPVWVVYGHVRG